MRQLARDTGNLNSIIFHVKLTVNVLSLLGGLFVMLMITSNKNLRSFSFYLILNVSCTTVLVSMANFLILDTTDYQSSDTFCQIQAFSTGVLETS